jgi:hypothetical protein
MRPCVPEDENPNRGGGLLAAELGTRLGTPDSTGVPLAFRADKPDNTPESQAISQAGTHGTHGTPQDDEAELSETQPAPRAWLLATSYGLVWIASDPEAAAELRAEESDWERLGDPPIPVLEPGDIERLRGKSPEAIGTVLRVYATFPGARVLA